MTDNTDGLQRRGPWLAAAEGYYGPPLEWAARLDLIRWLSEHQFDGYVYAPKDDPLHRERWRDPYPAAEMGRFDALHRACLAGGMELSISLSPGPGWAVDGGDVAHVVAKLAAFESLGVRRFCIQWDDLFEGGARAGQRHGRAVAEIVQHFGDHIRWVTAPDDYALVEPTDYLLAFAESLPPGIGVAWTGPGVLSRRFELAAVRRLESRLGQRIVFAENFPVNDLAMSDSLHLGPYPLRDPALPEHVAEVHVNFMPLPLASRIGLAGAASFWRSPTIDRTEAWNAAIAAIEGLEPIARACRSWMDDPGPDPKLLEMLDGVDAGDDGLQLFLEHGCRTGLSDHLAVELEPWLAQWDAEAAAMLAALGVLTSLRNGDVAVREIWAAARLWRSARQGEKQAFGTRLALYGSTRHDGHRFVAAPGVVVAGRNLTDLLWERVLSRLEESHELASRAT